jgi:hypothetical protein
MLQVLFVVMSIVLCYATECWQLHDKSRKLNRSCIVEFILQCLVQSDPLEELIVKDFQHSTCIAIPGT